MSIFRKNKVSTVKHGQRYMILVQQGTDTNHIAIFEKIGHRYDVNT